MLSLALGRSQNSLNVAVNRQDYLFNLKLAIEALHNCSAKWRETVPVHEVFRGQTVWKGEVEVYDLSGHPKARRAYGWAHAEGENSEGQRYVAVLEIPPVDSAQKAVQVQIVKDVKQKDEHRDRLTIFRKDAGRSE